MRRELAPAQSRKAAEGQGDTRGSARRYEHSSTFQTIHPVLAELFVILSHKRWPSENDPVPFGRTLGNGSHVSKKWIRRIRAGLENV